MGQMQRILKNLSESEAYHVLEQERNLHFASLYVAILAFLTGVLVAPRIASRIIKPLKAMNQGAKQIAGGDLNVTIEVNTRDEVGELGLAFNQMAKEL
jgi:nitrogen fixation/metabolism regulation signal transduction histidine kinase